MHMPPYHGADLSMALHQRQQGLRRFEHVAIDPWASDRNRLMMKGQQERPPGLGFQPIAEQLEVP